MQEEQIAIILYGDDIDKHQNKLTPFSTYLISTAKVRAPLPYGLPVNTFEWVVDRFTVVEQIKEDNTDDPPLPTLTRINTISLENLEQEPRHIEFDVLAVVVSYGAIKFAGIHGNKCRQIVVMDANELAAQIENHPVILAKRIARSSNAGISLTTRYNSTILIYPVYPQVAELINWVKDNEEMLNTYTERSSAAMSIHDDIIPIGNIKTQSAMQSFHVEGKMSFLDDDNRIFYELMCPKCMNVVRTKIIKGIDCGNFQEDTMLTLRET
ncbi:replication protein A 70 kDa DNA-binding subunit B-like [Capsicum chacoense]